MLAHESRQAEIGWQGSVADLKAMQERFRLYGLIALGIIIISFFLALFLSSFLQQSISKPILGLAKAARAVSDQQDYSVRAKKIGNDEIGALTDAFNHMLFQIQDQNKALSEFNKNLEQKVIERTKELEIANQEQKEAEEEISKKNKALAKALEELQIAEEHLRKLNNDLERRVRDRTNELLASERAFKEVKPVQYRKATEAIAKEKKEKQTKNK